MHISVNKEFPASILCFVVNFTYVHVLYNIKEKPQLYRSYTERQKREILCPMCALTFHNVYVESDVYFSQKEEGKGFNKTNSNKDIYCTHSMKAKFNEKIV